MEDRQQILASQTGDMREGTAAFMEKGHQSTGTVEPLWSPSGRHLAVRGDLLRLSRFLSVRRIGIRCRFLNRRGLLCVCSVGASRKVGLSRFRFANSLPLLGYWEGLFMFSPLWGESHELGGARQGQLFFEGHKSITYSMVYVPPNRSNALLCHLFVSPKFNLF
jgi:hypothetical protein